MEKVLVLGASGMLGNSVYKELKKSNLKVTGTRRASHKSEYPEFIEFEVDDSFRVFLDENLPNFDYVVNCIGLIPHKFLAEDSHDLFWSVKVNSVFPNVLAEVASSFDCKVLQIATDCIFSGNEGDYSEASSPDPRDVYGITKLCGEIDKRNVMNIRCSIIGLELNSSYSLLSWLLSQSQDAKVKGYSNHVWNGVTSLAYAKVVKGIIERGRFLKGTYHLIPRDSKTKCELIKLFTLYGERLDLNIEPWEAEQAIDRTLSTIYPDINKALWDSAGYSKAPLIEDLIAELFKGARVEKSNE